MSRGNRRRVVGVVKSDRMDKSVVVEVHRLVKHPLYRKYVRRWAKVMAHDEENTAHVGDRVELIETRPLSKQKSWRVVQIVARGSVGERGEALEEEMTAAGRSTAEKADAAPSEAAPAEAEVETPQESTEADAAPSEEAPAEAEPEIAQERAEGDEQP